MLLLVLSMVPAFYIWIGGGNVDTPRTAAPATLAAGFVSAAFHAVWWHHRYPREALASVEEIEAENHVDWGVKHGLGYAGCAALIAVAVFGVAFAGALASDQPADWGSLGLLLGVTLVGYAVMGLVAGLLVGQLRPLVTTPVRLVAAGFGVGSVVYLLCLPVALVFWELDPEPLDLGIPTLLALAILLGGLVGPPAAVGRSLRTWTPS